MPLHESLTAEDLERFRAYVASFPPSNAADRTMPTVASPSEPSPSLRPFPTFPTPRPTHASINGTEPIAVTPSPFTAAPLHSAAASRVASSSSTFGWAGQSTNNNSFLPSTNHNNNSFPQVNVPSYSMPSSLAPTIQDQVRSMHRAFDEHDDNVSVASGLSNAHTATPFPTMDATPFPTMDRRASTASIFSNHSFLTDEDMAKPGCLFHQHASPIRLTSGSMEVQGSLAGSSAYALQFEASTSPDSLPFHQCLFGVDLTPQMRLTFDDDPTINSLHRHRLVLIGKAHGKVFGLDVCPSDSSTIRVFPLLLVLRNRTRELDGYIAHLFLRGSTSVDPTKMMWVTLNVRP